MLVHFSLFFLWTESLVVQAFIVKYLQDDTVENSDWRLKLNLHFCHYRYLMKREQNPASRRTLTLCFIVTESQDMSMLLIGPNGAKACLMVSSPSS